VLAWFLGTAECVLDLVQMFFTIEQFVPFTKIGGEKVLESWDREKVPGKYVFSARPDAATRLDVSQKRAESMNRYKIMRRDELVNAQRLIADVFESHDVDPTEGFAQPNPPAEPAPKQPSFSFDDESLINPLAVAIIQRLMKITPKEIEAARILQADCGIPVAPKTIVPDAQQVEEPAPAPPPGAEGVSGADVPHPGKTPEVTPLNQRYAENGGNVDQGMVGEGTGKV
jgi:hypothetical protein